MIQPKVFTSALPHNTALLIAEIQKEQPEFLNDFYLSGGTALALQLGHRESDDLDFFRQEDFDPSAIEQQLLKISNLEETELARGTLNSFLRGVKLQFLHYPYELIKPTFLWSGLNLSSLEDIACTKMQTIGMRGSKKDFIDLFFLLKHFTLSNLFELMQRKYRQINYSQTHVLKSLVYFEDAEQQPMPRMHQEVSWVEIKRTMVETVKRQRF